MKQLLGLEIKKTLKSRLSIVLIAVALLISAGLGLLVITFVHYRGLDEHGNYVQLNGFDAVSAIKENTAKFEGFLTPEVFGDAIGRYQDFYEQYDGNIPSEVYIKEFKDTEQFLYMASQNYRNPETGYPMMPSEISVEQAESFYSARDARLEREYFSSYYDNPKALEQLNEMNGRLSKPFYYVDFNGWENAGEYLTFVIFFLAIICSVIAAPIFSADYQSGADRIIRCTKNGKKMLAAVKALSVLIVSVFGFFVCIAIYLTIVCLALGTECFVASLQVMRVYSIVPITIGQLHLFTVAFGLMSLICVVSFSFFISSISKIPLVSVVIIIAVTLLPTFLKLGDSIATVNWVKYLLPSGGVGLGHNIYYELSLQTNFLEIGRFTIWAPYIMIFATIIQTILYFFLGKRIYKKHET